MMNMSTITIYNIDDHIFRALFSHPQECFDWAVEVCRTGGINRNFVNLSAFMEVTGSHLLTFSEFDFYRFDNYCGAWLHYEFQRLLEKRGVGELLRISLVQILQLP